MELKERYVDERNNIEYVLVGDYYVPNFKIPKAENYIIGKYGRMRLNHIKKYDKVLYIELMLDCKLNSYLHNIDEQCNSLLASIIQELAKKENVTEELKNTNQLEWVSKMNNIKNRAEEIIYKEYIYV